MTEGDQSATGRRNRKEDTAHRCPLTHSLPNDDHIGMPRSRASSLHLGQSIDGRCDLHHRLNLSESSLASARFLCRSLATSAECRSNLIVLRVGNQFDYGHLDLLANEVLAVVERDIGSTDITVVFSRLTSIRVDQAQWITDEVRDALLYRVANASTLRTMNWTAYRQQSHHALPPPVQLAIPAFIDPPSL